MEIKTESDGNDQFNKNIKLMEPTPTGDDSSVYYRKKSYDDDEIIKAHIKSLQIVKSSTRYGMYASNLAVITSFGLIICGIGILWWAMVLPEEYATGRHIFAGIYSIFIGPCIYIFERLKAHDRPITKLPYRMISYICLSSLCFLSLPTLFAGAFLVVVGLVQGYSWYLKEEYLPKPQEKSYAGVNTIFSSIFWCFKYDKFKLCGDDGNYSQWWQKIKDEDRVGEIYFLILYIASNIVVWTYYLIIWFDKLDQTPWSKWIPFAKAFGSALDFNIALVLLPVCRSLIRWLYDHSTADQSFSSRCLRSILYFIPLDKAIEFHTLIGYVILFHSIGHTVAHLFNYVIRKSEVWDIFGIGIWLTGAFLWLIIFLMYGAIAKNVKLYQFELFYYTHHLFILFFIINLIHGDGWWKWVLFPSLLYILERIYREYKSRKPVCILSMTNMSNNVYCLELEKSGSLSSYKEGQYVFLKCPYVSATEWHPFTISSAPQTETVTLHIRALEEGSWTQKLQEYLNMMAIKGTSHITFDRLEHGRKVAGKTIGPNGQPILKVYGPLSAPTQHLSEYSNVMIITSGIGVTPLSAAIDSIVHRWRYFMGQSYPDNAYLYWICSHDQLTEFRWFIRKIKCAMDQITNMRIKMPNDMVHRRCEVHLFVTSFKQYNPEEDAELQFEMDSNADIAFWGQRTVDQQVQITGNEWSEADLYYAMRNIQPNESYPVAFGDQVFVYNGRPNWENQFEQVFHNHPNNNIGVLFCGNKHIGNDLKLQCRKWSGKSTNRLFHLHEEKF